jgi:hypothetical protein
MQAVMRPLQSANAPQSAHAAGAEPHPHDAPRSAGELAVLLIDRKKHPKMTAAQKILLTAKLRETRQLRGTLGKRQKKRLKAPTEGLTIAVDPTPRAGRAALRASHPLAGTTGNLPNGF